MIEDLDVFGELHGKAINICMSHNIQISAPTPKLFVESRKRD
jgi:hypothetical protein